MKPLPLLLLVTTLLVPAALPCDDQADAAGQCGASQEPSLARLVEDLHGENVLSRLLPPSDPTSPTQRGKHEETPPPQTPLAEDKNSNREAAVAATTRKEPQQRRAATDVQRTETDVGKDKEKPPPPSKEETSNPAAAQIRSRPSSSDGKEVAGKDKTPTKVQAANREATAHKTAQNKIQSTDAAHLKLGTEKDKKIQSSDVAHLKHGTEKDKKIQSSDAAHLKHGTERDKKIQSSDAAHLKHGTEKDKKIQSSDVAHLKHGTEKDKAAPSLSKGKSLNADAVTKKVSGTAVAGERRVKEVTSPSLSGGGKTAKTSAGAAGSEVQRVVSAKNSEGKETPVRGKDKPTPSPSDDDKKTAEKRPPRRQPATDSARKQVHGSKTEVAKEAQPERKDVRNSPQAQRLAAATPEQVAERQKRDVEETPRRPREVGDVQRVGETLRRDGKEVAAKKAIVVEAEGVTTKENVTGESPPKNVSKSDDGKADRSRLPQVQAGTGEGNKVDKSIKQADHEGTVVVPRVTGGGKEGESQVKDAKEQQRPSASAEQSGKERRQRDEHVHFVTGGTTAEGDGKVAEETAGSAHGTPAAPQDPEALPLTGHEEPEAMSLKTRRHPDSGDDDGRGGQEGDEARQADPRRFPAGGYRPTGKSDAPVLQFPALPEGETFRTPELGLSEGLFLFSYLGDFLSWLQPYDFPVELVRDALWNRVTVTDLITESLQVEIGFIICLCIGALFALMLPIIAMCHACCNMVRGSKKGGGDRSSWDSSSSGGSCRRRGLLCSLHFVLLLLVAGVTAMFVTNEQVSSAVHSTPSVVHTALGDVGAFVRTTHHQLSFVTTKSLEQALSAATDDLDNADVLLGRPIQQEIAHEAGADVALEALSDVLTAVNDVSQKAVVLHEQCSETRGLALVAKERLADLRHQVDMAKRQCVGRDRALCDTLDVSGLDVVIKLEMLMSDDQLAALRSLRNGNFSAAAQQAKGDFQLIPREVEESTREARLGIRRELVRQRSYVQDSLVSLDSLSRDVGVRVDAARNLVMSAMQTVEEMEQWRWLVGLGASLTMLLLWLLLMSGAACGCCGSQEKARTTLIVGVSMTSVFSLVLWVMTLVTLVMGGHGEVFICRPLYASPDYSALSRLLDRPGVLFPRAGGGFFRNVVGGDGGPNRTLDVPLRQVLQECEAGIPAYNALQLRQVFDTEFATGHGRWDSLRMQLSRLNVDVASLRVLTPGLQVQLENILSASGANVTQHRLALGGAVTARDLNTLADQLLGIASQASDLAMASRLETLAARTRRLLASHVLPLEQRKEDLVYRLTSLEVSLVPLQRQTNQSLSHLKAIQYYVTHQGESIAQSAVNHYTTRILSYLQQARAHILASVVKDVAPCRPLFEVFNAARQLLCRHIVDPLNGLWFASALSLLLLLIATPLCLKLVDAFKQNREGGLLTSNMSEYNIKSEKGLF